MKRLFSLLVLICVACCFAGCSDETIKQKPSETFDMMVGSWEYDFEDCAYSLRFEENGEFSNSCACGSPVGDSDLVETFVYDDSTKNIYLYGPDKELVSTGKLESVDDTTITVTLFGEKCTYTRR